MHTLDAIGGESALLLNPETAHIVADAHRLLSSQEITGVEVQAEETPEAIIVHIVVTKGARVENPIHLCFGMLEPTGTQRIKLDIIVEDEANATFLAHCLFANAQSAQHLMDAEIKIGADAEMRMIESHYHGPFGGIEVVPKAVVDIGPNSRFFSDFSLTMGRVGRLDIDYRVTVDTHGVAELTSRVFGHVNDYIKIREEVDLIGESARSLVKTRVAIEDQAIAEVTGITNGAAKGARGHLDCMEIVKDEAIGQSIPIVKVTHPLAKVTHEAAIGTVDKEQLETLMAHGLSPEQAVDIIVSGLLR